jgi:hypothetical protein
MRKIIVYISGAYTNGGTFILKAREMAIKIETREQKKQ